MIVNAASRMFSAISFGVFWRFAPSIKLIMRSRKPSPGSALTRTMSQSESTRVPPVTALRSPPASRITGALSPVIGALVHRRNAFDHLAVGRDDVAGLDQDDIVLAQRGRGDRFRLQDGASRHVVAATFLPDAGRFVASVAASA